MPRGQHADVQGRRFGRLVALEYRGNGYWLCRCDCGNQKVVRYSNMRPDRDRMTRTFSCGCQNRDAWERAGQRRGGRPSAAGASTRLRQARQSQGIALRRLAELSGVAYPTISQIETGDQSISPYAERLAEALGVSLRWLLVGQD